MYVWVIDIESIKWRFFSRPLKHEDDNIAMFSESLSLKSQDSIENHEFLEINDRILVQREKIPSKIKEIAKYLDEDLWFFPNSIIFWVEKNDWLKVEFNPLEWFDGNLYTLSFKNNDDKILFIIDGQHRIEWAFRKYYNKLILHIKAILEANEDTENLDKLNVILTKKSEDINVSATSSIEQLAKFVEEKYSNYIFENKLNRFKMNFSIVIFHKITKSKMIEIFTDINSSSTRLNTNLTRYFYGRFTSKKPFLKIAVNVWKFLNEGKSSPLYGYIKMPYKFEDDNPLSQVSISAFCQRLQEFSLLDLAWKKRLDKINFYMKPFWLVLFHEFINNFDIENYLNWKLYTRESIEESTTFLFRFLAYSFNNFKDLFLAHKNSDKGKFIDSSTIELYMYIAQEIFANFLLDWIEINNLIKEWVDKKNKLKNRINVEFNKNFSKPLLRTFQRYDFFIKWSKKNTWTWWWKSSEIVSSFKIFYFNPELIWKKDIVISDWFDKYLQNIEKLKSDKMNKFNQLVISYFNL